MCKTVMMYVQLEDIYIYSCEKNNLVWVWLIIDVQQSLPFAIKITLLCWKKKVSLLLKTFYQGAKAQLSTNLSTQTQHVNKLVEPCSYQNDNIFVRREI
jgi:hypothetical protein